MRFHFYPYVTDAEDFIIPVLMRLEKSIGFIYYSEFIDEYYFYKVPSGGISLKTQVHVLT